MLLKFCTQYVSKLGKLYSGHSTGKGPFSFQSQRRAMPNCGAGEDSWRVPWTARRSNQSILKEINLEYSIGRTDAEAPILWPHDGKSWLTGKDPDAGQDWRQKEKRAAEDELVTQHHRLNEHEFEDRGAWYAAVHLITKNWTQLRDWTTTSILARKSHGLKSLAIFSPWDCKRVRHNLVTKNNKTSTVRHRFLPHPALRNGLNIPCFHTSVALYTLLPQWGMVIFPSFNLEKLSPLLRPSPNVIFHGMLLLTSFINFFCHTVLSIICLSLSSTVLWVLRIVTGTQKIFNKWLLKEWIN